MTSWYRGQLIGCLFFPCDLPGQVFSVVGTSGVYPEGGRLVARDCTAYDGSHSRIRYESPPLRDA
jgi:hypothetical protein